MFKLVVNTPSGIQELIIVGEGGKYFDDDRVVYDIRVDSSVRLDESQVGGLSRVENPDGTLKELLFSNADKNASDVKVQEKADDAAAEVLKRENAITALRDVDSATTLLQLKAKVKALADLAGIK